MEWAFGEGEDKYVVSTVVDIENDYEVVCGMVEVDETYITRMKACEVKLCIKYMDKTVAVMYLEEDKYLTNAVTLYGYDMYGLMWLLYVVWKEYNIRKIRVVPHNREDVKKYTSMATGSSLRRFHNGRNYIEIHVERLKEKMSKCIENRL